MPKKICMLVHSHPFLDARIYKKEVRSLVKKGYNVTMIVPRRKGLLFDIDKKPFNNRFLEQSFEYEGVKIVTYNSEEYNVSIEELRSNCFSTTHEGFQDPLTKLGIKENADIYHAHEYLSFYSGIGIKRALHKLNGKKVKLIYDSHELTPDPLDRAYSSKEKLLTKMLDHMLHEIDQVITVSESIKSWYLKKKPDLKVEVIYNSPPLSSNYTYVNSDKKGLNVCYEGGVHGKKGNLNKIIQITNKLAARMDFNFKIIGGLTNNRKILVPPSIQNNINITGWVDYHSIPNHMKDVDIGWIDFADLSHSLNRYYAMPNKFFSYLNNGLPVVVNNCHDMKEFITKYECGYVVNKKNANAMDYVKALILLNNNKKILRQMSINARKVMEEKYCWELMEKRLYEVYEELCR